MNRKLLIGISSVGVAAGFWACGSGTVEPLDQDTDGFVQAMLETGSIDFAVQVKPSKEQCALDPVCSNEAARQQGAVLATESSSELVVESSSSVAVSQAVQSSSSNIFTFSSAGPIGPVSSSSSETTPVIVSSSSEKEVLPAGTFGTCAPSPTTGELNTPVTWSFTWDAQGSGVATAEIMKAEYAWTFAGEGASQTTASGSKSASVTYTVSGGKTASVNVTTSQHGMQSIQCKALNVNGAKISGCKCVSVNVAPDVFGGESAEWAVTGCTTAAPAQITSYTWTGATAADATGLSASAPVTEKGQMVTGVSVSVANDDNSIEVVKCEDAKAIDSSKPDYLLEDQNTAIALPAGSSTLVLNLPANWHNGTTGTCTFSCGFQNGSASGTVAGVALTGSYHMTASIPISKTINSTAVPVELSEAASCQVGW